MHKRESKLVRLIVLLIVTLMICSQIFGIVVYARGGGMSGSHSTSRSPSSRSTSTRSTPSSSAKSGSFSTSPKSSSKVGSSATKPSSSPKSVNSTNSTIVVNNHTYVSHYSSGFLFMHRSYYVDNYGITHYTAYRPNLGSIVLGLIIGGIIFYVIIRIIRNNRY